MVDRLEEAEHKIRDIPREIEKSIQRNGAKVEKLAYKSRIGMISTT